MTDYMVLKSSEIEIQTEPLSTATLLALAAQALAKAIGARLGEEIGERLSDAILGKDKSSARFESEVIERLTRIEGKLNDIFNLLHALPGAFRRELKQNELDEKLLALAGLQRGLSLLLESAPPVDKQDKEHAERLYALSQKILDISNTLIELGPAGHVGIIMAVPLVASALCRSFQHDQERRDYHLKLLAAMARSYGATIRHWTGPDGLPIFAHHYHRLQAIEGAAIAVKNTLPANILLCVRNVNFGIHGTESWGYRAYFAYQPDGSIHYGLQDGVWRAIRPALPEPIDFDKFIPHGVKKVHWWNPRFEQPTTPNNNFHGYFHEASSIVREADRVVREYPPQILECATSMISIAQLLEALDLYTRVDSGTTISTENIIEPN